MGDIHGQNIGHNHSLQKRYLSFYIHYINTVSFKQKGYCWTARTGRKMPKKCLGHVFKTLSAPHDVVQLSVNFWHLCLLGLGANLVLGSILVGNHLCKVAPKSENSLLFFLEQRWAAGPLGQRVLLDGDVTPLLQRAAACPIIGLWIGWLEGISIKRR